MHEYRVQSWPYNLVLLRGGGCRRKAEDEKLNGVDCEMDRP